MEPLVEQLKIIQADTFAFYIKSHNFHWNIEGPDFPQYHDFLNNLYQEVFAAVDTIAEEIRALGEYAPGSFSRYRELSSIKDSLSPPGPHQMFMELSGDNQIVLSSLMRGYKLAEQYNEIGLSNFIQDRYNVHKKHAWMINSILKSKQ
jgi:starvation-inducible DNA-binding protein